jgi:hypothetical protein
VVDVFCSAVALHGPPASLLCDNGAVFTATPRGGKVLLQLEMERLSVLLQRDPAAPGAGRAHALQAYSARLKARPPGSPSAETHFRIRHDEVDAGGTVTLRHDSKLHHIGLGRAPRAG